MSEAADQHEIEWVLRLFGGKTMQFGPPGEDFSKTVCIMAIPSEEDPVHEIGEEDKHATLLYFGDRGEHFPGGEVAKNLLIEAITKVADGMSPFTASVKKVDTLGDEGAQVWLLDSPELHQIFEEIPAARPEVQDMYDIATDNGVTRYPEYLPHVTIGYKDVPPSAQQVNEIEFDRLSLWWGNEHIDIPLGVGEFDALLMHFGGLDLGFDPSQPRAADGRWDPSGGSGQAKKKAPAKKTPAKKAEPPKMSKAQRAKALVEGVLDALDDVLDDLTSKQAQALIKRIKANAKAFIDGQSRSTPAGGGGGHKGGGGGKTTPASPKPKQGKGDGSGTEPAGGGGGPAADGSIEGIIRSVSSLIKGFGQNMKKADRDRLNKAVDGLQALDN